MPIGIEFGCPKKLVYSDSLSIFLMADKNHLSADLKHQTEPR
jgi:hypothetical protein